MESCFNVLVLIASALIHAWLNMSPLCQRQKARYRRVQQMTPVLWLLH